MLQDFGYDLWLNASTINKFQTSDKHLKLSYKTLVEIFNWVSIDLCKETKHVLTYPANNIRIVVKARDLNRDFSIPINYIDDSLFETLHPNLD